MARVFTSHATLSATVLAELERIARHGGVIAVPTESSYALCASPFDARGVQRIGAIKGHRNAKPILVLIGRREQLAALVRSVPPAAELLMTRCWPGPVTMVLPAVASLPVALTAGTGTIGVRLPDWPPLTEVLETVGPLTGTSANRSGEPPLMTAQAVAGTFGDELEAVLDLGPAGGDAPSTLIAFDHQQVLLLREGPFAVEQLRAILTPAGYRLTS